MLLGMPSQYWLSRNRVEHALTRIPSDTGWHYETDKVRLNLTPDQKQTDEVRQFRGGSFRATSVDALNNVLHQLWDHDKIPAFYMMRMWDSNTNIFLYRLCHRQVQHILTKSNVALTPEDIALQIEGGRDRTFAFDNMKRKVGKWIDDYIKDHNDIIAIKDTDLTLYALSSWALPLTRL